MALTSMTDQDKRDLAIAATNSFLQTQTTGKNINPSTYADLFLDSFDLFLEKIEARERAKKEAFDRDPFGSLESKFDNVEKINRVL